MIGPTRCWSGQLLRRRRDGGLVGVATVDGLARVVHELRLDLVLGVVWSHHLAFELGVAVVPLSELDCIALPPCSRTTKNKGQLICGV